LDIAPVGTLINFSKKKEPKPAAMKIIARGTNIKTNILLFTDIQFAPLMIQWVRIYHS